MNKGVPKVAPTPTTQPAISNATETAAVTLTPPKSNEGVEGGNLTEGNRNRTQSDSSDEQPPAPATQRLTVAFEGNATDAAATTAAAAAAAIKAKISQYSQIVERKPEAPVRYSNSIRPDAIVQGSDQMSATVKSTLELHRKINRQLEVSVYFISVVIMLI
jgi:hypothetical protein